MQYNGQETKNSKTFVDHHFKRSEILNALHIHFINFLSFTQA